FALPEFVEFNWRAGLSDSLSSPKGGEGRGEEANYSQTKIPSPQPSPRLSGEREKNQSPRTCGIQSLAERKLGRLRPWAWGADSVELFQPLFANLTSEKR